MLIHADFTTYAILKISKALNSSLCEVNTLRSRWENKSVIMKLLLYIVILSEASFSYYMHAKQSAAAVDRHE